MANDPAPLSHDAAAHQMIVAIRKMIQERLPGLGTYDTGHLRRFTAAASIPDEFFEAVAAGIDETPELGLANRLTSAEARDVITRSLVYNAFADQLEQIVRGVRTVIIEERYDVGHRALAVYGTAKSISRPNRSPVPHVEIMRRALGRRKKKKSAPAEPGEPESE